MQREVSRVRAWMRVAGALGAAAALAGCRTGRIAEKEIVPPSSPAAQPAELVKELAFDVQAVGLGEASLLAQGMATAVQGCLAGQGYICRIADPDVLVDLRTSCAVFDRSEGTVLYQGRVDGTVKLALGDRLLGGETLTAMGLRGLDAEAGFFNLSTALTAQVSAWIGRVCAPERMPVAASEFTVHRSWVTGNQPAFIDRMVRAAKGMPGVASCRLAREDHEKRLFVFHVVYDREAYPQGILNAILLTHGKELGLTR